MSTPSADFASYFHDRAGRFSAFYRSEPVSRLLGRGPMFDRLSGSLRMLEALGARTVLDVGCGSGPLLDALAQRQVAATGIDPAPAMVARAEQVARAHPDLVTVRQEGWEALAETDAYDAAVALGVFDYVDEPVELLRRMAAAAPQVIGSFPAPGLRLRLRQVRYGRRGVHVHGYRAEDLEGMARQAGTQVAERVPLGRAGHLVRFSRR